ncbi:MAG TPA: GNAT family N-acetyltransferase [Oligoflexia bacterium]|nr:GNAT family N-acetyltransferase [Oligoflexia bacterium]HMP27275.1 GNAT family N-acetyltransferase [Oligoflexia bacterium]
MFFKAVLGGRQDFQILPRQAEENQHSTVALPQAPKLSFEIKRMSLGHFDESVALLSSDPNLAFMPEEKKLLLSMLQAPRLWGQAVNLVALAGDCEPGDGSGIARHRVVGVFLGTAGFRGCVNHLITSATVRGFGVGKALLLAGVRELINKGAPRIVLTVTADNNAPEAARGFYENFGFEIQPGEATLEVDAQMIAQKCGLLLTKYN